MLSDYSANLTWTSIGLNGVLAGLLHWGVASRQRAMVRSLDERPPAGGAPKTPAVTTTTPAKTEQT